MRRASGSNFVIWLCVATAFLVVAVRVYVVRKLRQSRPGSVADLVRRGQLRSDRRGMYDFNPQCFLLLSSLCIVSVDIVEQLLFCGLNDLPRIPTSIPEE
jgi:hypothetical protein